MPNRRKLVLRRGRAKLQLNSVGPSRDGHEFHEIWVARKCFQLVMPRDNFIGMAIEGLEPASQKAVSAEAAEIADVTLFYGEDCSFNGAKEYVIAQFKYSVSREHVPFRASDAKKTLKKFAAAYRDLRKAHSKESVSKKLQLEIVTNRPMYEPFAEAIEAIATRKKTTGEVRKQAEQIRNACGMTETDLVSLARRLSVTGLAGSLSENQQALSRQMVDWSAAPDILAKARLEGIKSLVRKKAGSEGIGRNLIRRTDVWAALDIASSDDLLPCPSSFPEIGPVVERDQLADAAAKIPQLTRTLVVHAAGGVGKTVFMQSLANVLGKDHKTILFDCFGGGNYRAPDDSRHLPKFALVHIVNSLAIEGLCDPLLPSSDNQEELIKAFKARLEQAIRAIRRYKPHAQLLLFLDAIDNAAEHARERDEDPFPTLLIESFHHKGAVPGVQLIVSCRTHRKDRATNNTKCDELELKPFTLDETSGYLLDRLPNVSDAEIRVAQSRSLGNPRVLEHLALSDRGLLGSTETDNVIDLDELIKARIENALAVAYHRGNKEDDILVFLGGLAILPPPVPTSDYALASGLDESEIQSFASDMAPLLEMSRHGLMFRDEPTEDYIKKNFAGNPENLKALSAKLCSLQNTSAYAAGALPWLLLARGDGDQLFQLAFDERYPSSITSAVGRQNIKYSRLKAAVRHAVSEKNYNHLVHFCVELSTLAATNERGIEYILDNPDLVIAADDSDSLRRLLEVRTTWPGKREARLSIANALAGDKNGAEKHASNATEWIYHFYQQDDDYQRKTRGPSRLDMAAVPLCRAVNGDHIGAAKFFSHWKAWYAFEVAGSLFPLLRHSLGSGSIAASAYDAFINASHSSLPLVLGVLAYAEISEETCGEMVQAAASLCDKKKEVEYGARTYSDELVRLDAGLLKASVRAINFNMKAEASSILFLLERKRPGIWTYNERHSYESLCPFLIKAVISAIARDVQITPQDFLPEELDRLGISSHLKGKELAAEITSKFEAHAKQEKVEHNRSAEYSYEQKRTLEKFLNNTLGQVFTAGSHLHEVLISAKGQCGNAFLNMVGKWDEHVQAERKVHGHDEQKIFMVFLYLDLLSFLIWAREDISAACIKAFTTTLYEARFISINKLCRLIEIFALREHLRTYAGELSAYARKKVESEDEVNSRASGFADLARAMLPASRDEAAAYFRLGLEQMDSIGSGDYQFTNELLLFASELEGEELSNQDVHTLSNICELNIYEAEKFPWASFGYGFSKVAGRRILAKLARWDDRDKVPLNYSLLPCLTALIEHRKIDPTIAVSLLQVSNPAELHACGTGHLADVLVDKKVSITKAVAVELVDQFQKNNPGYFMAETYTQLSRLAKESLGEDSETYRLLQEGGRHYASVRRAYNDNQNYHGKHDSLLRVDADEDKRLKKEKVSALVGKTDPNDTDSLAQGLEALDQIEWIYDLKQSFYDGIRSKVSYGGRCAYVRAIAGFEHLDIYLKLKELKDCKAEWGATTLALEAVFKDIALPLIQSHGDDFVQFDSLSVSKLSEISALSGMPVPVLATEVVRVYASPDGHVPASVWIGLAALLNGEASSGEGQKALVRLLNSNAAKLSSTVVDGPWEDTLAVDINEQEVAAALVWRMLGAPKAEGRWRAAHSVRAFARFGRWDVIKLLIDRYHSDNAGAYQAPELTFFHLHAKLWSLIALARIALDFPKEIAAYKTFLIRVAMDEVLPHVLLQHFAASALSACVNAGALKLTAKEKASLSKVNKSPNRIVESDSYANDFYSRRPDGAPYVEPKFSFEYDFNKHDVQQLANIFEVDRWELENVATTWVRKFDMNVGGMYETGGREIPYRHRHRTDSSHHSYGYQLGWHAHYLAAGELLRTKNILKRSYDSGNPWSEWLRDEVLSRQDGLWISDGLDSTPFDTCVNLQVKGEKGLELTGDKSTLLKLLGIGPAISENLVVKGHWRSTDGVEIEVTSALVPPQRALQFAKKLSKEAPFQAWLPTYTAGDDREDYLMGEREGCVPWIARGERSARLDRYDPFGASCVLDKYRLAHNFNQKYSLKSYDPFERQWFDGKGTMVLQSQAWGDNDQNEESSNTGLRLRCATDFLMHFLKEEDKDLVILVLLRKYDKDYSSERSKYHHTMAVAHVTKSLDFCYIEGIKNKLDVSEY